MTCQRAREECAREGAKLGAAEGAEPTACTDSSGPNTYRLRDLRALLYVDRIPRSVGVGVRSRCEGGAFASAMSSTFGGVPQGASDPVQDPPGDTDDGSASGPSVVADWSGRAASNGNVRSAARTSGPVLGPTSTSTRPARHDPKGERQQRRAECVATAACKPSTAARASRQIGAVVAGAPQENFALSVVILEPRSDLNSILSKCNIQH